MDHRRTPARPRARGRLLFEHEESLDHVDDPLARDISAAASIGRCLFVASDEGATIERLVARGHGVYAEHEDIPLGVFFDLPDGPFGEMDVEGLAVDSGYLWIVGSHSLTRDEPEPASQDLGQALAELHDIDRDPNRWFLGKVPLVDRGSGIFDLVEEITEGDVTRRARKVRMDDDGGNQLSEAAGDDVHLGPFLEVPAKENGFDVEGLAVRGGRVYLGLRGPVLSGWAIVLELSVKDEKKRRIELQKIDGGRYRKHFLDLEGLGIRDLLLVGDDLYVLAGPTMHLDGPTRLYRWPGALQSEWTDFAPRPDLEFVADIPYLHGHDHAEALAVVGDDELLVAYDSPSPERLTEDGTGLVVDLFDLERMGALHSP